MPDILPIAAADGHRFEAALYRAASPKAPLLIFFPALGTPHHVYRHIAAALTRLGIHVAVPDWRGIGSSSIRAGRRSDFGYREMVEIDAPATIAALRAQLPETALWVGGHSMGGQLSGLIATQTPATQGMLLISSGSVLARGYSPLIRYGIYAVRAVAWLSAPWLGYFPGRRIGFGGREANGVMRDWLHVARTGDYRPCGSNIDYEKLLPRLHFPVLALNFAADRWAPHAAAQNLLAKFSNCRRDHWLWQAADCNGLDFDHFTWTKQPDIVAPRVAQWLLSHCAA